MKPFEKGDIVHVAGPPGEVIGEVLEAATPDEMPDLGPGSKSEEVLDLVREMRVDLILLIAHRHDDCTVCFWAVHNPGGWVGLQSQELTVLKGYRGGVG